MKKKTTQPYEIVLFFIINRVHGVIMLTVHSVGLEGVRPIDERPGDQHVYLSLGYLIQKLDACTKDKRGVFFLHFFS